jgi:hypothetical protein
MSPFDDMKEKAAGFFTSLLRATCGERQAVALWLAPELAEG